MLTLFCFVAAAITLVASLDISIPSTAPSNASTVAPDYISFSIEQDHWTDWVGPDKQSKNEFFFNALENIVQLTGVPPRFRIGADSEDRTDFQPGLEFTEETNFPPSAATPYAEASNITVGEAFYLAAQNLPPDTHVTWGVNFKSDNITAAFLEAQAIGDAFNSFPPSSGLVLDAIEIGNEPNLYSSGGKYRPENYSIEDYASEWTSFATNISAAVSIPGRFWGGSFAGSATHNATGFAPQGLFSTGILSTSPGKQIKTFSQHFYNMGGGLDCGTIPSCIQGLMSKAHVRGNLTQWIPDIAVVKAQGLSYVFGETNTFTAHGLSNVSNSAGAALWVLDDVFYASQLGVDRHYFHEGVGYKYNFIQPVTLNVSITDGTPLNPPLPPHVQPAYYAAIVAAEAIGSDGGTRVSELSINSSTVSGYAFFTSGGQLTKALFINSESFFSGTSPANRTSVHLDLDISGTKAPLSMAVKRLVIGHADDTSGLTWGGQTYETPDAKIGGTPSVETSDVSAGIDIPATQAVLVSFES